MNNRKGSFETDEFYLKIANCTNKTNSTRRCNVTVTDCDPLAFVDVADDDDDSTTEEAGGKIGNDNVGDEAVVVIDGVDVGDEVVVCATPDDDVGISVAME